ncbi:MAG: YfbM family protein [Candidatus Binatus sp.]|uniref:YfbM family protein n=1 Tax=Candidatus Binatus sp. TaxID=2811406 RepID=UPI003BAF9515
MSMMGRFVQVSPDRLKQIIEDPSGVEGLFVTEQVSQAIPKMMETWQASLRKRTPQMLAASIAAMDPAKREMVLKGYAAAGVDVDALARGEVSGETLANLMMERGRALAAAAGLKPPPASTNKAQASGKGASISIEKAWHGLHYLLCGQAVPGSDLASQVVMGGTDVGEDLGYGPARYFDAAKVAAIANELTRPNLEAEMMARWDPDQMTNLGIYPAVFEPDDDQWLMDAFRKVRQFFVDASAANLAVVTCLE